MEEERRAKEAKLADGELEEDQDQLQLLSFNDFRVERTLKENAQHKTIFVQGNISGRPGPAVVILEKRPFSAETIQEVLSESTDLRFLMHNDIYRQYEARIESKLNAAQATVIYPATDELIAKLKSQEKHFVRETPNDYETITKPYIEKESQSLQWIYNILDHKAEQERIVYEDPDPNVGFVLLPDLKWDQEHMENLYLLGVCHARGIASLRDLRLEHVPLLKNMMQQGREAIFNRYGIPLSQIKTYVHYQPTYYHFHMHYLHTSFEHPGGLVGKAHLVEDIIDNLEKFGTTYYKERTLTFALRDTETLWKRFQKN
ncbi:m7GpppX diphosphatase-like [Oscarella lobularis]|uniref:m7GpppX diphosphatase-like n=1 Tax=Oscarella lobularis TaxID=121494 RepID=UPI003313C49C